jgi:hypothetical protein
MGERLARIAQFLCVTRAGQPSLINNGRSFNTLGFFMKRRHITALWPHKDAAL